MYPQAASGRSLGRGAAWRALACLASALVILAACGADQATGRVGETIIAGDYQVTVKSMENPAERPDRFTNPKGGNRFVKFDLKVANAGAQHLPVFAAHFTMKDSGGIDNPPRTDLSGDTILKQVSLAPGQSAERTLYFEMAANQNPIELVFTPGVVGWRTRVTVNLGS